MEYNPIILRKTDYNVIKVEGEIYWKAKLTLQHFGFNEPLSGL